MSNAPEPAHRRYCSFLDIEAGRMSGPTTSSAPAHRRAWCSPLFPRRPESAPTTGLARCLCSTTCSSPAAVTRYRCPGRLRTWWQNCASSVADPERRSGCPRCALDGRSAGASLRRDLSRGCRRAGARRRALRVRRGKHVRRRRSPPTPSTRQPFPTFWRTTPNTRRSISSRHRTPCVPLPRSTPLPSVPYVVLSKGMPFGLEDDPPGFTVEEFEVGLGRRAGRAGDASCPERRTRSSRTAVTTFRFSGQMW